MSRLPRTYIPQLATLVKTPPEGDEWLHEMKYDGYRIGCRIDGQTVTLLSRNGKDWTEAFPEIIEAARKLDVDRALLDGEIAMLMPDGRTSFQALQNAFTAAGDRRGLVYFVFDALHLDGDDLTKLPLDARKARLATIRGIHAKGRIRRSEHIGPSPGAGAREIFAHACHLGVEGIISKRRDAPYRAGRRPEWVKTKCVQRQEFVIGGFTEPEGSRKGIGSLLVGYYERGRLVFAGKVGTGFTHAGALELRRTLEAIERRSSPFEPPPPGWLGRHAHWVAPRLVCEVVFTEWTDDGKIRHPSFQGLRRDKKPTEVAREQPLAVSTGPTPANRGPRSNVPGPRSTVRGPRSTVRGPRSTVRGPRSEVRGTQTEVAGVRLTHPDRIIFPEAPMTKAGLAAYYESIAEWILPHLEDRPLTLVRCPDGAGGECFYMKHSKVWAPEAVRRVRIREKTKIGEYLIVDTLPALIGLVQMGVLEIHTWNSRFARVEQPDRIVFDVDPGPDVEWRAVKAAARLIRDALDALDLASFVKTTGGRGLHVVVPLRAERDWSECLAFSRALSERIADEHPEIYTTTFAKKGREDKILIDYLRNNRTNTSVAAFSTRRRPHGPVSVPLAWEELDRDVTPDQFTVLSMAKRLTRITTQRRDPWAAYWGSRQRIGARAYRAIVGRSR